MTDEKLEFARKLRKQMTPPERAIWERLRCNRLGVRFRRQAAMFGYIADFWCPACSLAVEIDGMHHAQQREYDRQRDAHFARFGVRVLRFTAGEVFRDPDGVVDRISDVVRDRCKPTRR